jgi:hypothetical protein
MQLGQMALLPECHTVRLFESKPLSLTQSYLGKSHVPVVSSRTLVCICIDVELTIAAKFRSPYHYMVNLQAKQLTVNATPSISHIALVCMGLPRTKNNADSNSECPFSWSTESSLLVLNTENNALYPDSGCAFAAAIMFNNLSSVSLVTPLG